MRGVEATTLGDNLVLRFLTDQLVDEHRARGTRTTYHVHQNATHSGVVEDNPGEPPGSSRRSCASCLPVGQATFRMRPDAQPNAESSPRHHTSAAGQGP